MRKPTPETVGPIGLISAILGESDTGVKLVISILVSYLIALVYINFLKDTSPIVKHLYLMNTGFLLCLFTYHFQVYHSILSILTTYVLLRVMRHSRYLSSVNFIIQTVHVMIGYYFCVYEDDMIQWIPHSILAVRLIGFCFDVSDGQLPGEVLPNERMETALNYIPSLLELAGFAYFPSTFPFGGQIPFRRYKRFVQGEFDEQSGNVEVGLKRGALGLMYLIVSQVGFRFFPEKYFFTREFQYSVLIRKIVILSIWTRVRLYKYVACLLLAEGSSMCFGITYAGTDENGQPNWFGYSNVKIKAFETATKIGDYIDSFNTTTNKWVIQNIYKRQNLGRGRRSCLLVFIFLGIMNGFYSGYYMTFFFIHLVLNFEMQFEAIFNPLRIKYNGILDSKPVKWIYWIITRFYVNAAIGWCWIPYVYLTYPRYFVTFRVFDFYGLVFLSSWFFGRSIFMCLATSIKRSPVHQHVG